MIYLMDIGEKDAGLYRCFVHASVGDDGQEKVIGREFMLPEDGIMVPPDGDVPFEGMDDVYVSLTPAAEAIVARG